MVTLRHVMKEVVKEELPFENMDSAEKRLRRKFKKLIQRCGGDMETLYGGKGQISFPDEEKEFVKIILVQLAREDGLSHKIWEDKDDSLTLKEVHDFIQYFIDYLTKKGYSATEAMGVARALDMMFQLSAREKLEFCHRMLDCYAENLAPYPYTHQIIGLEKLANKLMAESARSIVEVAICCSDLADFIKKAIELEAIESAGDLYGDDDDFSRDEYIERDKRVLLYMKKHPEIRKIVEEQIGEPITSIWKDAEV